MTLLFPAEKVEKSEPQSLTAVRMVTIAGTDTPVVTKTQSPTVETPTETPRRVLGTLPKTAIMSEAGTDTYSN